MAETGSRYIGYLAKQAGSWRTCTAGLLVALKDLGANAAGLLRKLIVHGPTKWT